MPRRATVVAAIALLLIGALSAWLRGPGFTQGGFASHDVAAMLHSSLLLLDGGLPYVDSIELKAPGTFYLGVLLAGGTDIAAFQIAANLWAMASLGVVAMIAWRQWGPAAAVVAAGLYALHDAHLDSMDANYVTWAQLPLTAGVGVALGAPRGATRRRQWVRWMAAGALVGAAVLLKRPAVAGVLVATGLALWPTATDRLSRRGRVLAVLAGVLVAHVPIAVHYAAAGQLPALVDGYVLNRWGMRYVQQGGGVDDAGGFPAVEGLLALVHFLALPLALAMTAVVPPRDDRARRQWGALVLWTLATLVAASIGLRFYKGYFLAVAPPLCLWAAAPWGLLGARTRSAGQEQGAGQEQVQEALLRRLRRLRGRRGGLRALLLLPALVLALRQLAVLEHLRADRARPHDQGGRVIARVVLRDHRPGDRIWVWGWHLWDVYPLTGMRAASRVYKSLGLLTQANDDTWRTPSSRLRFVDGPAAEILLEDLRANRPAWIVLGSTVPRRQFTALQQLLREQYQLERKVRLGRVQFWHRKDRAAAMRAQMRDRQRHR
ncbi:MAG: hypothetical protein AAGF11_39315 [Myxococcota bacterium]